MTPDDLLRKRRFEVAVPHRDLWPLSGRVPTRATELAMLDAVSRPADGSGPARLIGDDLPSAKNAMVAPPSESFWVTPASREDADGRSPWSLVRAGDEIAPPPRWLPKK